MVCLKITLSVFGPSITEFVEKKHQLENAKDELILYQERYKEELKSVMNNNKQKEYVQNIQSSLPEDEDLSSFLLMIENNALELDIKIKSIENGNRNTAVNNEPNKSENVNGIEFLTIFITAEGNANSLIEFVERLEKMERACEVSQLEFKINDENTEKDMVRMTLLINLYFYSSAKGAGND